MQIRVPGFGDTDTIEYLTKAKLPQCKLLYSGILYQTKGVIFIKYPIIRPFRLLVARYFVDMVSLLVSHGYRRGFSVRAAPYDFRKAQSKAEQLVLNPVISFIYLMKFSLDEQDGYFNELKVLVEETYTMNHKGKVTFIAHSLGNMYLLYFLNRQTQQWKDKYVASFISMGGPWAGAVKALKVVATGDDMDIPVVSGSSMKEVLRTTPSVCVLSTHRYQWQNK